MLGDCHILYDNWITHKYRKSNVYSAISRAIINEHKLLVPVKNKEKQDLA